MRAVTIPDPNEPDRLELIDLPLPEPKQGEVRVKFTSIGLNRADLLYPHGRYFVKPTQGSRLGFEGAGFIDACDSDSVFKVGDHVGIFPMLDFDVVNQGSLAEYGVYKESQLIRTPQSVSHEDAGAIWMAYLTAWGGMVDAGNLGEGQHVVITAASSSVGIAAIQIAQQMNAISIATTTSDDKAQILKQVGANHVIVQAKDKAGIDHYVDQVRHITQDQGSDLVFDAVAGPATHGLVKASKRGGTIVIHGLLDRRPMDIHAGVLMKRLLTIKGYTLDQTLSDTNKRNAAVRFLNSGFEQNILQPTIASRFTLENYAAALQCLGENKHIGKIVVTP